MHWQEQLEAEVERDRRRGAALPDLGGLPLQPDAFAMTRTKAPYLRGPRARSSRRGPGSSTTDAGSAPTGSLLARGGLPGRLRRLRQPVARAICAGGWSARARRADVHDLDRGRPPAGFDLAYAFDVIEHVADPFEFLGERWRRARRSCWSTSSSPSRARPALHHDLPTSARCCAGAPRGACGPTTVHHGAVAPRRLRPRRGWSIARLVARALGRLR